MRLGAAVLLALALVSCSGSAPATVVVTPSPGQSIAADLRTQLDLILGEQVMIVAKLSSAAVNHTDDYAGYATLLNANATDLSRVLSRAVGNTASGQLIERWNEQNGYLVAYTNARASHDDDKAKAALQPLTTENVSAFAELLADAVGIPVQEVGELVSGQLASDRAFIDDVAAQKYPALYPDLHKAYSGSAALGDAVALGIVRRFPDKFPGDVAHDTVDRRVALNLLLQEHAYVATMASAAVVGSRTGEASAARNALSTNRDALASLFGDSFTGVWTARNDNLMGYAAGDRAARTRLTVDFVSSFASTAGVSPSLVAGQLEATLEVIDDQRAKAAKDVAGDDRAAAAAMQPIADAVAT